MNNLNQYFKDKFKDRFIENESLKNYSTFKLETFGQLIKIVSIDELKDVLKKIKKERKTFRVIGRGSNLAISGGLNHYYLKLEFPVDENQFKMENNTYRFPSNTTNAKIINLCQNANLIGAVCLTGIPGTIGGAVWMNAGTSKGSISDLTTEVTYLNTDLQIVRHKISECDFSYRKNNFLSEEDIILEVQLTLLPNSHHKINSKDEVQEYLDYRKQTQPLKENSCGCLFKNNQPHSLQAGKALDILGLKGFQLFGLEVSTIHGNFILNKKSAKHDDFCAFAGIIKDELLLQYGISFEYEIDFDLHSR